MFIRIVVAAAVVVISCKVCATYENCCSIKTVINVLREEYSSENKYVRELDSNTNSQAVYNLTGKLGNSTAVVVAVTWLYSCLCSTISRSSGAPDRGPLREEGDGWSRFANVCVVENNIINKKQLLVISSFGGSHQMTTAAQLDTHTL